VRSPVGFGAVRRVRVVPGWVVLSASQSSSSGHAMAPLGCLWLVRYVADEELRRRVRRQLNKGESLHALRRISAMSGLPDCYGRRPSKTDH
jgi:Tn3 transposase DDE domain